MSVSIPSSLSQKEANFCALFVCGCDPYAGNARKCYEEVFLDNSQTALKSARELMARDDIKFYIERLRDIHEYKTAEMKARLTEKLLRIVDETSTAIYTDRRGTPLSPAPLRSVAVQATKALMEMYPVRVAEESKFEFKGGENGEIVFNIVAPQNKETLGE
jgi:hypothetical protein